jgi:hypothetical protein
MAIVVNISAADFVRLVQSNRLEDFRTVTAARQKTPWFPPKNRDRAML